MNNALIIGVILIIAGIALAIFAYMVITSDDRRGRERGEIETEQSSAVPTPSEDILDGEIDDVPGEATPPEDHPDLDIKPSIEPALMDAHPEEPVEQGEEAQVTEPEQPQPAAPPPGKDRIQVATLLRDDVTGKLIIRVGEREYASADELRSSPDWTRVQYAASDLNTWVSTPEPSASASKGSEPDVGGESKTAEREPSSMIEQINSILQTRIEASGRSELAVRLIEGPGGMARVLIGVHSYEIGEVPDPEVRELIRQAVAAWESTQ
ncbi:MAG: hypothetical protein P1P76_03825 [Anaerolineales bacterium]|nr:hypothetical protein [Anaerolineales bacterium]